MYFEATSIGSFKASKNLHKQQLRFGKMGWWHCLCETALYFHEGKEVIKFSKKLSGWPPVSRNRTVHIKMLFFALIVIHLPKKLAECESDLQNVVSSSIFSFRLPSVLQDLSSSRVGHSSVHCGIHSTTSSISTCSFSGFHCPTPGLVTNGSFLKTTI